MTKRASNGYLTREYHRLCEIVFDYERKMLKKQNSNSQKWNYTLSDISRHFLKRFCDTFFIPNFCKDLMYKLIYLFKSENKNLFQFFVFREMLTFIEKLSAENDVEKADYELVSWRIQVFTTKYDKQLGSMSELFEEAQDTVELVKKSAINLLTDYLVRYSSVIRTFPIYSTSTQDTLQLLINIYAGLHTLFKHIGNSHADQLKVLLVDKLTNKVWV